MGRQDETRLSSRVITRFESPAPAPRYESPAPGPPTPPIPIMSQPQPTIQAQIRTPQATPQRPSNTPKSKRQPRAVSPPPNTHRLPGLFITTRPPSTPKRAPTVALPSSAHRRTTSSFSQSQPANPRLSRVALQEFADLIFELSKADQSNKEYHGQLSVMERLEEALLPLADFIMDMDLDIKIQRSTVKPLYSVSFTCST